MADTSTTPAAPATVEVHALVASKTSSGVERIAQLDRVGTERAEACLQAHDAQHTIVNVRMYPDGTGIVTVHRALGPGEQKTMQVVGALHLLSERIEAAMPPNPQFVAIPRLVKP